MIRFAHINVKFSGRQYRWLSSSVGQFGVRGLHRPKDFVSLAQHAIDKSNVILGEIVDAKPSAEIIHKMDHISDIGKLSLSQWNLYEI